MAHKVLGLPIGTDSIRRESYIWSCAVRSQPLRPQMVSPSTPPNDMLQKGQESRGWDPSGSFLAPQSLHPRNCHHFWPLMLSSRFKSTTSHRDRGGPDRDHQSCRHFGPLVFLSRFKSTNSHRDRGGPRLIQIFYRTINPPPPRWYGGYIPT